MNGPATSKSRACTRWSPSDEVRGEHVAPVADFARFGLSLNNKKNQRKDAGNLQRTTERRWKRFSMTEEGEE